MVPIKATVVPNILLDVNFSLKSIIAKNIVKIGLEDCIMLDADAVVYCIPIF